MQHLAAGACLSGRSGEQAGLQLKRIALSKAELTSCFKHARLSSAHGSSRIVAPARRMVLLDVVHEGGSQGSSSMLHYSGTQESLSQQYSFSQQVSFSLDSSQSTGVDMRTIFPGAGRGRVGVSPGSPAAAVEPAAAAAEADAPAVRTPARTSKQSGGSRGSSGQSTPVRGGIGLGARSVALKAVFGSQHLSLKRSTSSKTKSSSNSSSRRDGGSSRLSKGSRGALVARAQAAGLQRAATSIIDPGSGAAMRAALSALSISSTRRERRIGQALAGLLTTQLSRRNAVPTSALSMTVAQAAQVLQAAATSPGSRPADTGCQDPATITLAGVMAAAAAGVAGRSQAGPTQPA
jgi:hypothetical protein